jgi:hypothetical protein
VTVFVSTRAEQLLTQPAEARQLLVLMPFVLETGRDPVLNSSGGILKQGPEIHRAHKQKQNDSHAGSA